MQKRNDYDYEHEHDYDYDYDYGSSLATCHPPLSLVFFQRSAGEPLAERVATATDPLNLMRVMPP